jgi:hypothetical protein
VRADLLGGRVGVAAATLLAIAFTPAAAVAYVVAGPPGDVCSAAPVAEPGTTNAGSFVVRGGPLAGDGTVTCRVLPFPGTYSSPGGAAASAAGTGVVVLAPTLLPLHAALTSYSVCTTFTPDGAAPLYWDAVRLAWSTSAATLCARVVAITPSLNATAPFYPTGVVEISSSPLGTTVRFSGFNPPVSKWRCELAGSAVSCVPPPAPAGGFNVCGTISVQVTNDNVGEVTGETGCGWGREARTSASAPTFATASASAPYADFPWRCSASADVLAILPWTVRCSVAA